MEEYLRNDEEMYKFLTCQDKVDADTDNNTDRKANTAEKNEHQNIILGEHND